MKTQTIFFILPFAICILCIFVGNHGSFTSMEALAFLGFWSVVFPTMAINQAMGSLHQKELFISMPISPAFYGILQPIFICILYGGLLTGSMIVSANGKISGQTVGFLAAVIFLTLLTCLAINLFKNAAIGLFLALIYVIMGMFTTGTGQGPFYLFQWFRPRMGHLPEDYALIQLIGAIVLCGMNYWVIKNRSKFHWMPF